MRRTLSAVLLVLSTAGAFAQDVDAESALRRARKLAALEPAAAARSLEALAEESAATPAQRVRGTRIALEALPMEDGNRVAASLVLAVLSEHRSDPDAWQLAFRVRDRVMDGLDLVHGEPYLRALIRLYPDQLRFQYYLADLYLDTGRPETADAVCMEILRQVPDDTRARHLQAYIRELDGRVEEALELYAQVHDINGELEPLLYRVRILIDPVRDYAAAEIALREAFDAVAQAPPGRSRNQVRADLEYEEMRIADERARRRELLGIEARQDELLYVILGCWSAALGGGVLLLRRRQLI